MTRERIFPNFSTYPVAKRINEAPRRVNVDFPEWMIHSLDKEASRLGVTRQSIIKVWISERLGHRPS